MSDHDYRPICPKCGDFQNRDLMGEPLAHQRCDPDEYGRQVATAIIARGFAHPTEGLELAQAVLLILAGKEL